MAISTRLRAPSLAIRLAMWVLTVLRRDVQLVGDLAVGPPARHGGEDLLLAVGERLDRAARGGAAGPASAKAREQPGGDARGDERVAVGGGVDGLGEQRRAGVLEQEAPGAGPQRGVDVLVEVEGGDDDDGERVGDVRPGEQRGWPRCRPGRACGCRTGTRRGAGAGPARRPAARRRPRRRPRCPAGRRGSS